MLFVTVDPERDTPAVLKAYTAAFDPQFLALYGTLDQLAATAAEYKVTYLKVPTGASYGMDHTASTYVYDPQGRLRLRWAHGLGAQDIAADVRQLLKPI